MVSGARVPNVSDEQIGRPAPASSGHPPAAASVHSYTFGPFRIDVAARHLLRGNDVVPLTAKAFLTLLVLVKNHDRAVSKDELVHAVWPGTFVTDDSLVQSISAIRRALGDDPSEPRFIATLSRRGYRFLAPVEEYTDKDAPTGAPGHVDQPAVLAAVAPARPPASRALLWVMTASVAVLALFAIVWIRMPSGNEVTPAARSMRFREILPAEETLSGGVALSPDSRHLAFVTRDSSGIGHLWVRALERDAAWRVEGTDGAVATPFWSPDSQFIGFFGVGQIKRVAVSGGSSLVIAATRRGPPQGATWGPHHLVLYSDQGRIFSVSDSGGTPALVLEPEPSVPSFELRWPQLLPDGRHFLVFASSENRSQSGTYLGTLGSRESIKLVGSSSPAIFAPPGHLLYIRDGIVMAQRFDLVRRQLQGQPMTVAERVPADAMLSATSGGLLAWSKQNTWERLVWVDRRGNELGPTIEMSKLLPTEILALSPDNRYLLGFGSEGVALGMWLIDLERNVSTRIAANAIFPAWAPDGVRFAFSALGDDAANLVVKSITGTPDEATWLKTRNMNLVNDWSADGRYIVFDIYNSTRDLWLLPTFGDRTPRPFLQTPAREHQAEVSPDGRWIAYTSDETGNMEVYVQSFPVPGSKKRISTMGGEWSAWRSDGRELFYLSGDRHLMAVPIRTGDGLEPGTPQRLFPAFVQAFAASSSGQRFLVMVQNTTDDPGSITLLTNWEAAQRP